ncbi:MAG: aminotransferase class I/II-fold pyridoxal phosphate-dependent enzyme, partial [Myxococcales bacterium]|nr:aminotransferase class I/II-fold pyridoxal phosphate-dependent enzyme [Myxococcales bacterium]
NYAFIIEDDYAADLAYAGRTPPTLFSRSAGHVIYVRSLTKSVAPSMRVAALCARGPVMRQLRASRVLDDFFVARPLQAAALELVSSSAFPRHLARLQRALGERMGHLCGKVQERLHGVEILAAPEGGYSLWLRLPAGMDDVALAGRALRAGVAVSAGAPWYPTMSVPGHLRLSVAGAPVEVLDAGLERLAAVIGL